MRGALSLLASVIGLLGGGSAEACEITRLMTGNSQVSEITNHWNGESYTTYLIKNNVRDNEGVLNDWIKFELIPQRWGFDLELPSGRRFAQVNKVDEKWEVSASPGYMDACAYNYVTLRKGASGKMDVFEGLTKIGEIDRFPFAELF